MSFIFNVCRLPPQNYTISYNRAAMYNRYTTSQAVITLNLRNYIHFIQVLQILNRRCFTYSEEADFDKIVT